MPTRPLLALLTAAALLAAAGEAGAQAKGADPQGAAAPSAPAGPPSAKAAPPAAQPDTAAPAAGTAAPATSAAPTTPTTPTPPAAPAPPASAATGPVEAPPPSPVPPGEPPTLVPPSAPVPPPAAPAPGLLDADHPSKLRVAAWVTTAGTVLLLAAGAITGLTAQTRADEISREQMSLNASGQPANYDAALDDRFKSLFSEGRMLNGIAIGLLSAAGAAAVASAALFIADRKAEGRAKAQAPRVLLLPSVTQQGGGLAAAVSF